MGIIDMNDDNNDQEKKKNTVAVQCPIGLFLNQRCKLSSKSDQYSLQNIQLCQQKKVVH